MPSIAYQKGACCLKQLPHLCMCMLVTLVVAPELLLAMTSVARPCRACNPGCTEMHRQAAWVLCTAAAGRQPGCRTCGWQVLHIAADVVCRAMLAAHLVSLPLVCCCEALGYQRVCLLLALLLCITAILQERAPAFLLPSQGYAACMSNATRDVHWPLESCSDGRSWLVVNNVSGWRVQLLHGGCNAAVVI